MHDVTFLFHEPYTGYKKEQLLQMLTKKFARLTPPKWKNLVACFCDTHMEIVNFSTKQKISRVNLSLYLPITLFDGRFAVIDEADLTLLIMNRDKIEHRFEKLHTDYVRSILQLRDTRIITSGKDLSLCIWDLDRKECTFVKENITETCVTYLFEMHNGNLLIGSESCLKIINLQDFSTIDEKDYHIIMGNVRAIIEPKPGCIIFGTGMGDIGRWSGGDFTSLDEGGHLSNITQLSDETFVSVSFCHPKNITVWNIQLERLKSIDVVDEISCLSLIGPKLALCDGDKSVFLIDLETGEVLSRVDMGETVRYLCLVY
jgi:WD40 repeat protein